MNDRPHLHITFFTKPVENKRKSRKENRPIFDDKEFVTIRFAGDKNSVLTVPAHQVRPRTGMTYAQQYPQHYELFQKDMEQVVGGTPLSELTFLSKARVKELNALNIHTAESLAGLEGTNLTRLGMGARELKNQAQAYIDKASDGAIDAKLAAQNASLMEEMAQLRAEMADMRGQKPPTTTNIELTAFDEYDDATLKVMISEFTGSKPRGTPSRQTMISSLVELQKQKEQKAA